MFEYIKTHIKFFLKKGVRMSYGQFGEDVLIQILLKNKSGIYIDVGAYHPVLYSNTYALYKRGWCGIVIEPNQKMMPVYKALRPCDVFVCAAIGQGSVGTYHTFNDGAYNTLNDDEAEKQKSLRHLTYLGSNSVPFKRLADILKEHNVTKIDFLNIDVEGLDLEVLHTHDWDVPIDVIAVEAHDFNPDQPQDSKVYSFLKLKDYNLVGFSGLTLVWRKN